MGKIRDAFIGFQPVLYDGGRVKRCRARIGVIERLALAFSPCGEPLIRRCATFSRKGRRDARAAFVDYRGRVVAPISVSSMAAAHWRPSRIAQTTSDWPRRMSPQANTFGSEVA